jgi:HAD superfamily hydrolase (TIGR01509 family)
LLALSDLHLKVSNSASWSIVSINYLSTPVPPWNINVIEWDAIDTVLLDMDGTLLDLHYDNYFWSEHVPQRYAEIHQQDEEESRQQLSAQFEQARGTLAWYSLDYWSEQLRLDIPALKQEVQHMIKIRPHVEEFLSRLQRSPKRVLLVTNAHRKALDIKLAQTQLGGWFDEIVVSHDLDVPKEDVEFWHRLQTLHPFQAEHTLLIDDTESVLDAAHHYGIAHLLTLLQPDSQLQKRLDTRFRGIHHFDEIMPAHHDE